MGPQSPHLCGSQPRPQMLYRKLSSARETSRFLGCRPGMEWAGEVRTVEEVTQDCRLCQVCSLQETKSNVQKQEVASQERHASHGRNTA